MTNPPQYIYKIKRDWFMGNNKWVNHTYLTPDKPIKIIELVELGELEDLPFSQWAKVIHAHTQSWMYDYVPCAYIQRIAQP